MRSSSGPLSLPWYRAIWSGVQRQRCAALPQWPQGQGFMAAINWKRAGNSARRPALDMVIVPVSRGLRATRRDANNDYLGHRVDKFKGGIADFNRSVFCNEQLLGKGRRTLQFRGRQ
jgi:hypothetical protein